MHDALWKKPAAELADGRGHADPVLADPNVGRVYPLNTHGSVVYLVPAERFRLYGLIAVAIIVGVTTICIELLKGPFPLRR